MGLTMVKQEVVYVVVVVEGGESEQKRCFRRPFILISAP